MTRNTSRSANGSGDQPRVNASSAIRSCPARTAGGSACTARTTATAAPTSSPNASSDGERHEPDHGRTGRHRPMDRHTPTGIHRLRNTGDTIMQHQLTDIENAVAGHDLDDDPQRTMQMLVWYVVTPMFLAGLGIIAWAVWTIVRHLA